MLLQWCDVMQRRNVAPWWRLPGRHSWRFPSADPLPEPTLPELQAEWQAAGMGAVTSPLSEAQGSTRHSQISQWHYMALRKSFSCQLLIPVIQELKQHIRICDLQILRCKPSPDTCATVQICEGDKCMHMQAWHVRSVYNIYIYVHTYTYIHAPPKKKKKNYLLATFTGIYGIFCNMLGNNVEAYFEEILAVVSRGGMYHIYIYTVCM